jgi:hypothetical protein
MKHLTQDKGLPIYALLAHALAKRFWVFSAQESNKALDDCV